MEAAALSFTTTPWVTLASIPSPVEQSVRQLSEHGIVIVNTQTPLQLTFDWDEKGVSCPWDTILLLCECSPNFTLCSPRFDILLQWLALVWWLFYRTELGSYLGFVCCLLPCFYLVPKSSWTSKVPIVKNIFVPILLSFKFFSRVYIF